MNDPIVIQTLAMLLVCITGGAGIILIAYGLAGIALSFARAILRLAKRTAA